MAQRKMRYRQIKTRLSTKAISSSFVTIFREELEAALREGRFPGLRMQMAVPPTRKKR